MTAPIRQILVHLDPTATAVRRLTAARRIALQHTADVAALYVAVPAFMVLPYAPEITPSVAASLVEIDSERRQRARQAFDRELAQPGPAVTWAQADEVPGATAFAQQALYADLLVLGQRDRDDEASACVPPDFIENVLNASGRPALVLPYIGPADRFGDTIAIAWKETPEAARAVHAALPFLQRARRVHVFAWGEPPAIAVTGRVLDLKQYLQAHGVDATWHQERSEPGNLGELLLSRIADMDADLLVMGCYGHSRAREWILGGVSRTVLQSMTVPVLMSH